MRIADIYHAARLIPVLVLHPAMLIVQQHPVFYRHIKKVAKAQIFAKLTSLGRIHNASTAVEPS